MKIYTAEELYPFEEDRRKRRGQRFNNGNIENCYLLDPFLTRGESEKKDAVAKGNEVEAT